MTLPIVLTIAGYIALLVVVNDPKCEQLLRLQGEHLTPIMSTGRNVPGETAPHRASSIDTLYIGMLWEEQNGMFRLL